MEAFAIRPAHGKPGIPIIEFKGEHRAPQFPPVLSILRSELQSFKVTGSEPFPDDFLWTCQCDHGSFEVSDDWGGLFIMPRSNHAVLIDALAAALERSGSFKRVEWWAGT